MLTVTNLPVNIQAKIRVDLVTGCWYWIAAKNSRGYGNSWWNGKPIAAHHLVYKLLVGNLPDDYDLVLDHTCHSPDWCIGGNICVHRSCTYPLHIDWVTTLENNLRGCRVVFQRQATHCVNNHEYTLANTGRKPNGSRRCRECSRLTMQRIRNARKNNPTPT